MSPGKQSPMIWPADLCHDGADRLYGYPSGTRRQALSMALERYMAGLSTCLAGQMDADPVFSDLVSEAMRAHGFDDSGEALPGAATASNQGYRTWFKSRVTERESSRRLLDAGDEALISHMTDTLYHMQSLHGVLDRMTVKACEAGAVYLTYRALEHYTGADIREVPRLIAQGRIRRPHSRWETAWEAYERGQLRRPVDTHQWIQPGLEVPTAVLYP